MKNLEAEPLRGSASRFFKGNAGCWGLDDDDDDDDDDGDDDNKNNNNSNSSYNMGLNEC